MAKKRMFRRKTDLPWQHMHIPTDDPDALENIQKIMQSSSYKMAIDDGEFLVDDMTLSFRLGLDFLKAEENFKKYGIEKCLVVFGSTRIIEEKLAKKKLDYAKEMLNQNPNDPKLLKSLKIAENIYKKSAFYEDAREFGKIVGKNSLKSSKDAPYLMTGGGPGIMEAANRGAYEVGAKSIGLNITLPHEQFPNPYITPDLCFLFYYFATRKMHFLKRAYALVIYPGGFGTLDELFDALTLIQTQKIEQIPVIFVGKEYWTKIINFEQLVEEGVIAAEDLEIFSYANSAQQAWNMIQEWYDKESFNS